MNSIRLIRPSARYQEEFIEKAAMSRTFHGPWVQPPRSKPEFQSYLKICQRKTNEAFWLLHSKHSLVGVVNVSEIVRGCFQSAYLGYFLFEFAAGQGHMTAGLRMVLDRSFGHLGLHRLEANVQPENLRSIQLIRRLGFQKEGFSPRYLRIDGEWRDHERWAILADDWFD